MKNLFPNSAPKSVTKDKITRHFTHRFSRRVVFSFFLFSIGHTLFYATPLSASGATSAEFLKILPGARPVAMGGAFTAVSDDKMALFYNPAGLSQLGFRQICASYNKWILDTSISNLIYAHTFGEHGSAAMGLTYYDSGPIEGMAEYKDQTIGDFKNLGLALALGYGNEFFEGFSVGVAMKFIGETVASESVSGFAADMGIHYKTILKFGETSCGATLKNIGGKLWEDYSLPLTVSLGIALKPAKDFLIIAADYNLPVSGTSGASLPPTMRLIYDNYVPASGAAGASSGGLGFEINPSDFFSLRAGYKIGLSDVSGPSALTFGFGYKYLAESEESGEISEYIFNYGFSTQGDLGLLHRIEIGYAF